MPSTTESPREHPAGRAAFLPATAAAVLFCALTCAGGCESATGEVHDAGVDADADADAEGGAPGDGGSAADADGASACALVDVGPAACRACLEASCCAETTVCLADTVCSRMLTCEESYAKKLATGADAGPPPNCAATEPAQAVILKWNPWATCNVEHCAAACPLSEMTHAR